MISPAITRLIEALRCLPGVGPKSAQRMVFYLLQHAREQAKLLASSLDYAASNVTHCNRCRTFSERDICLLCNNPNRDQSLLCIVETPIDMLVLEQTGTYRGYYFVLMGKLSPLDGIGPEEIGINQLLERLEKEPIKEVVLATNPTVEGDTTAHYIAEKCKAVNISCTRIARGVPLGSELEYLDSRTLTQAFTHRALLAEACD